MFLCASLNELGDARARFAGIGGEFAGRKICMLRNRLGRGEGALDAEFTKNLSRGRWTGGHGSSDEHQTGDGRNADHSDQANILFQNT